jgi:hypothetical protein
MRLNAINPSDNPMEQLLYCFGGDGDSGDSGSSDTGFDDGDVGGVDVGGQAQAPDSSGGFGGGGGDGGRDAFDASGSYVNQSIANFQAPAGVGTVMATPMQAATGQAGFSGPSVAAGGGDNDRDGIPNSIDAMPNTPNITPTFAPNLVNQPLTVGGQVAVMPYDSFQRSPQQMFGYGGLTAAPYSPSAVSFQGGAPAASFNPLGGSVISQFDMGRAPTPAGVPDDRSFFDRVSQNLGGMFGRQEQRAGVFDPRTGTFQQFDGQTTLAKTSDNMLADFAVNALNPFTGLTGFVDTKTYQPLAGGEEMQYSNFRGGLLSGMIGENLVPYSELEARNAEMGGDGGSDRPFIIPQEVAQRDPETGEPTAFPTFEPRRFEYQPYVGQFYTIPSRFTRPTSLLS